jgi:hypothetical protein
MERKVIQIAADPRNGNLIALASDGSIWIKTDDWYRMKDIPKPVGEELAARKRTIMEVASRVEPLDSVIADTIREMAE